MEEAAAFHGVSTRTRSPRSGWARAGEAPVMTSACCLVARVVMDLSCDGLRADGEIRTAHHLDH
ncbi:hypothetical protein AQI94_41805 [Streptomyces pseudovenezuelae]|uniref:Uncharacterized protein n=1 Tax=Streptomyces pseudovenezuelae TaxID=67350 RepID=A0A117PML0_9ACTN|nr:hypothetical protein AQI94_41805 [Streptomyces pseudovenezuelae]